MGYRNDWLPAMIAEYRADAGKVLYTDPVWAYQYPDMSGLMHVAFLGEVAVHVRRVLARYLPNGIFVKEHDGKSGLLTPVQADTKFVSVKEFMELPKRSPSELSIKVKGRDTFWISETDGRKDEPQFMSALKELATKYQRAVDACAGILSTSSFGISGTSRESAEPYWRAIRDICTTLDVLDENPPTDYLDKIRGAARHAAGKSAEVAGSAAAIAADEVGKLVGTVAGSASSGFFSSASFTSLIVVALVGYWYLT